MLKHTFGAFENLVRGYLEAIEFTECGPDNEPCDGFSQELRTAAEDDCRKFHALAVDMIDGDWRLAGHDLWLTRNGHGAGFWDGDWSNGDELTELVKDNFTEVWAYVGDDGLLYLS